MYRVPWQLRVVSVAYFYAVAFAGLFYFLTSFFTVPDVVVRLIGVLATLLTGGLIAAIILHWRLLSERPKEVGLSIWQGVQDRLRLGVAGVTLSLFISFISTAGIDVVSLVAQSVVQSTPDIAKYEGDATSRRAYLKAHHVVDKNPNGFFSWSASDPFYFNAAIRVQRDALNILLGEEAAKPALDMSEQAKDIYNKGDAELNRLSKDKGGLSSTSPLRARIEDGRKLMETGGEQTPLTNLGGGIKMETNRNPAVRTPSQGEGGGVWNEKKRRRD